MRTGFEFTRPKGRGLRQDIFRRYKLVLDGGVIASLKEGESVSVEAGPGEHELWAAIDWVRTPPLQVVLAPGEVASFQVGPGGTILQALFHALFSKKEYLHLERM